MPIYGLNTKLQPNEIEAFYKSPAIYVADNAVCDYIPAMEFTDLPPSHAFIEITDRDFNEFTPDELADEIKAKLASFAEQDYLLLSGNPTIVALALHTLLVRIAKVNTLHWQPWTKKYCASYIYSSIFKLPPSYFHVECDESTNVKVRL